MTRIEEKLQRLPDAPGVYQYFDGQGRLLYVGKAKSLKKRVRSYWRRKPAFRPNPDVGPRIAMMLAEARSLDYILVESEEDALILENSLIKQLKPKYNILLRDDKTYPYIYLDESAEYPRFELTRKVISGRQIRYYGPFPAGGRALLDALYLCYPLVQKSSCLHGKSACLFHQIGRCPAPCEGRITPQEYRQTVEEAKKGLENLSLVLAKLEERMQRLAREERYEEAAALRDQMQAIQSLSIRSDIDLARDEHYDILAVLPGTKRGVVLKLFLRHGKIAASAHHYFRRCELFEPEEAYRQAILSSYDPQAPLESRTLLIAHPLSDEEIRELQNTLARRMGRTITLLHPRRGPKARLVSLALKNARELLKERTERETMEERVAELLGLEEIPYRVEVFDNSHMMGAAPVGAMAVWDEGEWDKASYRRYRLTARDEYRQMSEMLQRRICDFDQTPPPDLWLLDGGETLRTLARSLLEQAGVRLEVAAIAKEKIDAKAHRAKGAARDLIYGPTGTIRLEPGDKRLQWLQQLRDEAHRFALAYHRKKKRREDLSLSLLQARGVGPATLRKLLNYFGSFERISRAELEELQAVVGARTGEKIFRELKQGIER